MRSQADSYGVMVGIANGKEIYSLVTIADENRHKLLRRSVAGAFSSNATLDYEPHIDRSIEDLLQVLGTDRVVDVSAKFAYYTMDAAGRFSFGQPLGCLAANDDAGGRIALIRERSRHWARWGSLPGLERLIFRNPIAMRMKRAPSSMASLAMQLLKERDEKSPGPSDTPDLMTRFLEARKGQPETLDKAAVAGLLMSTVSGAGDTTATALTAILFFLLKDPSTFAKLEEEIRTSDLHKPIPAFIQVSKLPYLHAVMREGMRLFPVLTMPIERKVPAGGASIAGTYFPEGTSVGCMQSAMHRNPKVFGEDAGLFRPERWLEADAERLRAMEVAHMGFSRGRRLCIGMHIAVMQMKKVIPTLIMGFEVSLSFLSKVKFAFCSLLDTDGSSRSAWLIRTLRSRDNLTVLLLARSH